MPQQLSRAAAMPGVISGQSSEVCPEILKFRGDIWFWVWESGSLAISELRKLIKTLVSC